MRNFKSKPIRIDIDLIDDLMNASIDRFQKKLSPGTMKDLGMPKMSNLMRRCPSYPNLLKEIRTLPEKKKNGK